MHCFVSKKAHLVEYPLLNREYVGFLVVGYQIFTPVFDVVYEAYPLIKNRLQLFQSLLR